MNGQANGQLRDLMEATAGDPPHRVTVEAVRRRVVRRRVKEGISIAACLAGMAGLGAAVAGGVPGPATGGVNAQEEHPPPYYVQQPAAGSTVVRATTGGAVTATVRCPWPGALIPPGAIASAGQQTFFIVCQKAATHGKQFAVTGSRIYRFHLTGSGQIHGYSLVPGGMLGPRRVGDISATPGGAQIAVTTAPGTPSASPVPAHVLVINTRTGARAVWHGGPKVPDAFDLTFVNQGLNLAFVTEARCGPASKPACRELREVTGAAAGGQLGRSRLIVQLSALDRSRADVINDVVISPDASTLTAAVMHSGGRGRDSVSIVKFSAVTGRRLRVVYRLHTGNGFLYRFFGADLAGRYLLFNAGPIHRTINGWINHGRLAPLKPANGTSILGEAW